MSKLIILTVGLVTSYASAAIFADSFEASVPSPENLILTKVSEKSLSVSWDKLEGVDRISLCYATRPFSTYKGKETSLQTLSEFAEKNAGRCQRAYGNRANLSELTQATKYYIVTIAESGKRVSPVPEDFAANTDILPPTQIRAKAFGRGASEVLWKVNPGATSYTIYLSEKATPLTTVKERSPKTLKAFIEANNGKVHNVKSVKDKKTLSYLVRQLRDKTEYYYVITSSKGGVEGYASTLHTLTSLGSMNDTGVTKAETFSAKDDSTCTQSTLGNQDCLFGRDKDYNDDSNGVAGFVFTKLDAKGTVLKADATEWQCVRDEITGLVWEVKTAYNREYTYTFYDARFGEEFDLNENRNDGGDDGVWAGVISNSTHRYAQQLNRQSYCGITDWRVPTREELRSIVHYGQENRNKARQIVLIDTKYFPNAQPNDYWTSSNVADTHLSAWTVYFGNGSDHTRKKDKERRVRLVYGNQ